MSFPTITYQVPVGTVNRIVPIYLENVLTSTRPGAMNIFASTVSASWFRSDATGVSSIAILSTAAMGTFSSGNWVQANSTLAPGWYEFGCPSQMFSSGQWAVLNLAALAVVGASPSPVFFEITRTDNQTYVSSQTLSTAVCRVYSSAMVTTAPGMLTVDCSTLFGAPFVTTAPGIQTVNVSSIYGVPAVTTAAGILAVGAVGVSSFGLRVGVSSFNLDVGVSSFNVGLQVGVSSFNSRVGVSSFNLPVGVSSFNVGLQVGVSSFGIDVGVSSINTALQVGVSSFNSRVGVSSFGIPVGVSSVADKSGYDLTTIYGSPVVTTQPGIPSANAKSINGITIVGDGSATPFNV